MRTSPAFTLLEVLIALTILSLAALGAGLAAPAWLSRAELERTAAAFDRLAIAARTAAVGTGRSMVLAFDGATRTVTVRDATERSWATFPSPHRGVSSRTTTDANTFIVPEAIGFTLTGMAGAPSSSLSAFGPSESGGRAAIVFLPDGTSTGGLVTLRDGGRLLSRRVAWLTGKVGPGE